MSRRFKIMLAVASIAVLFGLVSSCGFLDRQFEIRVGGTSGLKFSGSYMVVTGDGSNSRTVDGEVPTSYHAQCRMVSVAFQKKAQEGTLVVTILRNGTVVKSEQTTAEYGMVTVATE